MVAPSTDRWVRVGLAFVVLSSAACATHADPTTTPAAEIVDLGPRTEEVSFGSDGFQLVGDLDVPGGPGPHPAVVLVHGSGSQTRFSTPTSGLIQRKFLDADYAVLAWDKPGSGESTGDFDPERTLTQRAQILADAIGWLGRQDSIDATRIGVWGLSQAGWVMPLAMTMTDDITFVIVVSGGAEDSIEQMVFQWTEQAACRGASDAELEIMERYGAAALKAETYADHENAMEALLTISDLDFYVGRDIELAPPDEWQPWSREIDAFFDPVTVLEKTTIPVLAVFGEYDVQIDPVQGAEAYREALARAGNSDFRVETIEGAGHTMRPTDGPCGPESSGVSKEYVDLLDDWLRSHPAVDG